MNKAKLGFDYLNTLAPWKGDGNFSLSAIQEVLKRLGDPQDALPMVHVAGTNGKGSVSAGVSSILGAAGYRVGMNISPHLERINERFVVDGAPVEDDFIGEFAYEVRNSSTRSIRELSYHEALTALAFLGFRESGVEWGVIEVGLGGRLDASNVISRPVATTIVTIDYDHQHILGNTLGEIAREKAGIVKRGAPLVTGNVGPEAERSISQVVKNCATNWIRYRTDFGYETLDSGSSFWCRDIVGNAVSGTLSTSLPGHHQLHNMSVAAAVGAAIGMTVPHIEAGIKNVYWPGRLEEFQVYKHSFLMDCAHNPAGIAAFMSFLDANRLSGIDISFGVLDSKNWESMVSVLAPVVKHWRLLTPLSERALPIETLERFVRKVSGSEISVSVYGDRYADWLSDILSSDPSEKYALTGSMYLVGHLRKLMGVKMKPLWVRSNNV